MRFTKKAGMTALAAVLAACFTVSGTQTVGAAAPVAVYDSIGLYVPANVPSLGYQATQTNEFGDRVVLAGTARQLTSVIVEMSTWACQSGAWNTNDCVSNPGDKFEHPMTITLYNVDNATGALGTVIATATQTMSIAYRPSASPECTGADAGKWFDAFGCNNGWTRPVMFTFDGSITLPNELVWGVSYNTTHYGSAPIGTAAPCFSTPQGCAYDALNVGLSEAASPDVGTDVDNGAYWNTETAANYCDGGAGGTNTFRSDNNETNDCWTGYRPMATIGAAEPVVVDPDTDGDGVPDSVDNCTFDANPNQKDKDRDHIGDACEHDAVVKSFTAGSNDITVPKRGGSVTRDIELKIEGNHGPHGNVTRSVIEVGNLPSACSIANSGPDKRFGTRDDGPTVWAPGGILFDNTKSYAAYQVVTFKFKLKLTCSGSVHRGSVIALKAVADHGADDYPGPDDEDLVPANNKKFDTLRIK